MSNRNNYYKKWKKKNPDYHKRYYQKHSKKIIKTSRAWALNNPKKREKHLKKSHINRPKEMNEKRNRISKGICFCCGRTNPIIKGKEYNIIELHHLIHKKDNGSNKDNNLIGLCPICHRLHHTHNIPIQTLSY